MSDQRQGPCDFLFAADQVDAVSLPQDEIRSGIRRQRRTAFHRDDRGARFLAHTECGNRPAVSHMADGALEHANRFAGFDAANVRIQKRLVVALPDVQNGMIDSGGMDTKPVQYAANDRERRFEFLGNHGVGPGGVERVDFGLVTRACDDIGLRVQASCGGHAAAGRHRIRNGENHGPGLADAHPGKDGVTDGVAEKDGHAVLSGTGDGMRIHFKDGVWQFRSLQHRRDVSPVQAVTDNHSVVVEWHGRVPGVRRRFGNVPVAF